MWVCLFYLICVSSSALIIVGAVAAIVIIFLIVRWADKKWPRNPDDEDAGLW